MQNLQAHRHNELQPQAPLAPYAPCWRLWV